MPDKNTAWIEAALPACPGAGFQARLREELERRNGERQAGVKDPTGNLWFIATRFPGTPVLEGMRTVMPYLHASNALGLIEFLKQAFTAQEEGVYKTPVGR